MSLRIVLASSEVAPFSKTGGLADVSAALPKALARAGHHVTIICPYYPQEHRRRLPDEAPPVPTGYEFRIPIADRLIKGSILRSQLPDTNVPVYFVHQPHYYDREGLYQQGECDYHDNAERFIFFSRSVLEVIRILGLTPDVVHANDWQTGLIPALIKIERHLHPELERAASVFTIHNLAFQGQFWHWDMILTGIDWKHFNWREMEFYGHLNLLKTGIVYADMITTVSPTYAREIQTPQYGCGLHSVLVSRRDDLVGILNGVDTEVWNPATDPWIATPYRSETAVSGKAQCKQALQQELHLPLRPCPLYAMVSRLTEQKGVDLICETAADFLRLDLQLVILGSGDPHYQQQLRQLADSAPEKFVLALKYDEAMAHRIEAGADIFLMPSRYEPCGLNQMYSLIYGTLPIVRATGGLADSVVDATEVTIANGTANGFSFYDYSPPAFYRQICRAYGLYHDRRTWQQLMRTGMERDWSWQRSAAEYVNVYQAALRKRRLEMTLQG
ncbi:MAG: glycogen synthase [Planctomycetaceae bacterium]|nr:MAG: glycogen synthase [Planctomycetaceae bacterium]